MHLRKHNDQGFDDFRRERKRMRAKLSSPNTALGYENPALRELEEVEQREVHDQRLTREVHEFFASATRQAAGIVEKVARNAQEATGALVEQQMEAFLVDALARMNSFVVTVMQQRRSQVAETRMEPSVGNLVGPVLDEFRWEGTAEVGDKHIGQDPFATQVEDVQREFRAQVGANEGEGADALPIDEHLAARVHAQDGSDEPDPEDSMEEREPEGEQAVAPDLDSDDEVKVDKAADDQAAAAQRSARPAMPPKPMEELERFKTALKTLVRHGTLSREEARAAWQTRLESLGFKG
ncbi:MAG: hypothetical protein ABIP94_03640 [Planctomycetota bacterium]